MCSSSTRRPRQCNPPVILLLVTTLCQRVKDVFCFRSVQRQTVIVPRSRSEQLTVQSSQVHRFHLQTLTTVIYNIFYLEKDAILNESRGLDWWKFCVGAKSQDGKYFVK